MSKQSPLLVSVNAAECLLNPGVLDKLQAVLAEHAPGLAMGLHVWRYRQEKTPVEVAKPGSLREAVYNDVTSHGPLYYELLRRFGPRKYERICGSVELRGSDPGLNLVLRVDEMLFAPVAWKWIFGNTIDIGIQRARVDGVDRASWARRILEALCGAFSPLHAHANLADEYDAKNISHEGGGVMAIGVDASRYLPGLYWTNFLGKPYRDLIGRGRLLGAPAYEVKADDDGVLIVLHEDPRAWDTPEYKAVERRLLEHLGCEYFFDRDDPEKPTVAPDFGLPDLTTD